MNSNDPRSSDFSYKKYSLEQLDNWVNDALSCDDLTPQDIYNTIVKCVDDSVEYHKKNLTKSVELLSLLKGHREVDFGVGNDEQWDYTELDEKFPSTTQKDWIDFWEETYYPEEHQQYTSGAERYPAAYVYTDEEMNAMCKHAATENDKDKCREYIMPPWGHSDMEALRYTEEEMDAMCERAATENDKEKCREYNLREAEYYTKRAELDAEYDMIRNSGGYEWSSNMKSVGYNV